MKQISGRFIVLGIILAAINVAGIVWIHHDLTNTQPATVRATEVTVSPISYLVREGVGTVDRLKIRFDRKVAAVEEIGQVKDLAGFSLKPHWAGVWKWAQQDTLEYLFDAPVPPGRIINIEATDQFKAETGMVLDGEKSFEVRTLALALAVCRVTASDPQSVTIELAFNQPVAPADLLRHLSFFDATVADADSLGNVQCLTQDAQDKHVVRVRRPASSRLKVVIDENLRGPNADLSLDHAVVRTLKVPTGFCYLSNWISMPRLEEAVSVRLQFSKVLSLEQELPQVRTVPAVEELKVHRSHSELVLTGNFQPRTRYTITVPGTLTDTEKETLRQDQSITIDIPSRPAAISFSHQQGILSPHGELAVDLKAVNVKTADILVWRLHENNLASHLHSNPKYETSRLIPKKSVELKMSQDEIGEYTLDVDEVIENRCGVYHITAQSTSPRWVSTQTIVTVTDLAITAKTERNGCLVWVTSLRTGEPVGSATVKALSYNNQVLTTAITDPNGLAHLDYSDDNGDGSMWVITAQKGEDLSYLRTGDNQWLIDDIDQSGRAYADDIEVMLYAERGAYRPGDTIHLTGIVRQRDGGIPPVFPFSVKVTRPDGKEIAEINATPTEDSQGVFHLDVPTREDYQTGMYSLRATLPGDDNTLGSTTAFVEAFLPQRMKVDSQPFAERFDPNDTPGVKVQARYLWEEPAAEVPVKVEAYLYRIRYQSKKHKGYVFGMPNSSGAIYCPKVSDKLDGEGTASLEVPLPESLKPGVYEMTMTATVTEPGSRSVSSNNRATVDRLGHHIGLRVSAEQLVKPGEAVTIEWISLAPDDAPTGHGEMEAVLEVIEYNTVLKEVNGRKVWHSEQKVSEIKTLHIAAGEDAGGAFEVVCPDAGHYRLTVTDKESESRTRLELYASQHGARQSLAMNNPERLEIVCDKEKYLPGGKLKVLIRSSVSGLLLSTVESDRVNLWRMGRVINNTAEVEFDLPDDMRGGAFVTATVVSAVDPNEKSWLPHRAMGMMRIVFDHEAKNIPITIIAPDESEPGETISVAIETTPAEDPNMCGMVHLWAVDEGILLPTAYRTPDPREYFLSPRRSAVSTSDVFYRLLPDYERPATITRIGAGGPDGMGNLRRNPVSTVRREPDVIWRRAVPLDAEGKTTVEMKLPELIGQMRLMAVAVDHDRYGKGQRPVILTSDLIAEANWPRFAAPGDVFEVPVKLFNSTEEAMSVGIECAIEGAVTIENPPTEPVDVLPEKPVTIILKAKALEIGPVQVCITATQANDADAKATATSKAVLSVRPATALHGEVSLKAIKAGEQLTIEPSESLVSGTEQLTINISARANIQLAPALEKLISYPYGCVEQTTSRLAALVYAPQILGAEHTERINGMVQAGISRLWSMQTVSGGLSYWPGGTEPSLWGSAYAGWCLLECRNAGHAVDERFSDELMKYLESQLNSTGNDRDVRDTRALICHVLSTFGKPPHGWMSRLAEQACELDIAQIAHLAGAFHAAGDTDTAMKLLPSEMLNMTIDTTSSGRLTSHLQQHAVWLSVLLEIDSDHVMAAPLAKLIENSRRNGCWSSTLSNSAALVALSHYQAVMSENEPDFSGSIEIPDAGAVAFGDDKTLVHKIEKFSKSITVTSRGQGRIYIALSCEGLAKKGVVEPYDHRLTVRRRWLDRTGAVIDCNDIHVGDLLHVEIELATTEKVRVDNIAVVDALAGGMEVENPRLATSAASADNSGRRADHVEFLDDRVVLFCTASQKKSVFKFALRATTAGEFDLPPIQASGMYDPSVASLGEAGRITIKP